MPHSRNRPGHPYQKPSDVPAKQRAKGHTLWSILFAVFAMIIAYFAVGDHMAVLIIAAAAGAVIGHLVGRRMEKDASHR